MDNLSFNIPDLDNTYMNNFCFNANLRNFHFVTQFLHKKQIRNKQDTLIYITEATCLSTQAILPMDISVLRLI